MYAVVRTDISAFRLIRSASSARLSQLDGLLLLLLFPVDAGFSLLGGCIVLDVGESFQWVLCVVYYRFRARGVV